MNSIYKVIWSKAKNCYVVASEIAKSHTKSASGQSVRRSALASLLALSLLCGGLGVASAVDSVPVDASTTPGAAEVYTKEKVNDLLDGKADKADTLAGYGITNAYTKDEVYNKHEVYSAEEVAAALNTKQAAIDTLNDKTTEISYVAGEGTKISGVTITNGNIVGNGNSAITGLTNVETNQINGKSLAGTTVATEKEVADKVKAEADAREAADNKLEEKITKNTQDIATLDGKVTTAQGDIQTNANNIQTNSNAIADTNKRTGGIARNLEGTQTTIEGKVTVNNSGDVGGVKGLSAETITTTGNAVIGGKLGVTGETTLNDKLTAKGEATFEKNVTVEKDLTVDGKLNVGEIYLENNKLDAATGEKHDSATAIKADGISNLAKVTDKNGNTSESKFTHNEEGMFNYAKDEKFTGEWKGATSNVTADGVENIATDSKGNNNTFTQTSTDTKNILKDNDGNTSTTRQDSKGIYGYAKDKDGNKSYTKQEGNRIAESVIGQDGKQTKSEMTSTDITNTAKDGTITNDAKDIVNNATGDMTNNVGGNLSTTVGGNEIHDVKGTKTETVEGKLTENYNGGQETNVTGDQTTNVSGTQTTTATDINRNASSSMVDKVDNAYGTNTETKEAGKTTTDVSIKGTGEKGKYIRGANESRDYLIKDTLMNSETKTAEATSTEITDGTNKASTRQDAKNLAGSVTNGTEIGVSGIHANDDGSVSIDSAVAGGGMSSVINQKKDSIQSAVGDGTNSTVIHQDKDNVTIASSNGTVAIVGKDIVNNASESITNKAKTMDTTVTGKATESYGELDTTVNGMEKHTVNGNQDIHVTGKQTNTVEGGQENIISGGQTNTITGGQINNITGDQTTTITGKKTETVEGKVTEKFNNGQETTVTGDQDIHVTKNQTNEIGGNQTTTVTGDISNKAKNITNAADETLTDKVGENTRVITSRSITDTVGRANRMIEDGKITDNAGDFTVTTDKENGTTFTNAGSTASSFTTVDGTPTGRARESTNIKGNEISTGKVEANYVKMDYADVMHDLGVHGSATVDNDLTVKGITTTKTLKVTENATVGGTLDVTKKATFHDDVDITKNLSVGGNATITGDVTANSYKVGDKTYISADGINANNQKITNVADGSISEGSKDAVNGGQLYGVKRDLEHQVDKVGANAAAMANLRPMEFDPSSKWNIAAAIGNYGSETAAAIGAFYRPNDNVMVNLSTAFGTGENMVGGGVSVRLGKGGNKLSREETNALKAQVADLSARMDALLSVLNPNMSKDFPDVPENHWAYEAVSRLAGNDIVQGYPDGEFHGERTMTRYEMAEIIYNALSRGAEAERKLVEEFKPELQAMAASEKSTAEKAEG